MEQAEGAATTPIGRLLVERGLITPADLIWTLELQEKTGSRIGEILIGAGLVRRIDLFQALADAWHRPFIDLTVESIDPDLIADLDVAMLTRESWFPVRRESDGVMLVASAERPTDSLHTHISQVLDTPVRIVITTDWDILQAIQRSYHEGIANEASLGLWNRDPDRSARSVLIGRQRAGVIVGCFVLIAALIFDTQETLAVILMLTGLALSISVIFKFVVCMSGAKRERIPSVNEVDISTLSDDELPTYTVLVPVYKEANVVRGLIANLARLDYPPEKLQILLLLEESDHETRAEAMAAHPPETITFVSLPTRAPQTKPRACNVGLFFARGAYLVIYDAEDHPEPDQLKKAVMAFRTLPEKVVCVQAALNYYNTTDNALTRMFTLEYSFWFDYMLPGLDQLQLPIPLGGTSNHFRTDALRHLGGWDPFNVTEDADLGIRAAALGQTVGIISSTTYEEANSVYRNFIRQRSRWIKGYMITTLVHLRHPLELLRELGIRGSLGFLILIGGTCLSFLATLPLYVLFIISLAFTPSALMDHFPIWALWASLANLLVGNAVMIYISILGGFKRKTYDLVPWALLNPLYWILHSVASYKALWQLVFKPHYWEKTIHGLSTAGPDAIDASIAAERTLVA